MPFALPAWVPKHRRRKDPFTQATNNDLDIVMPPPYDMSDEPQEMERAKVKEMIALLSNGALDAGSREVLSNFINARVDQMTARLRAERDERQAVGDVLIGLAREEVAKRKPRYDSDLTRVLETREALEIAFHELTGKDQMGPFVVVPSRLDTDPITSTLGRVDLSHDFFDGTTPDDADTSASNGSAETPEQAAVSETDDTSAPDDAGTATTEAVIAHPTINGHSWPSGSPTATDDDLDRGSRRP